MSHDHAMFMDGVRVPAHLLCNGLTILAKRRTAVAFHHVELERHAILLAEGAPAESDPDRDNRAQFGNCPLSYDAGEAVAEPCADIVVAGGIRPDAARRSLPLPA